MNPRLLEHIHGHVGWLAAAALIHPAILLRKRRWAPLVVISSACMASLAGLLGAIIYPQYRIELKQSIYLASFSTGELFERKEHLAIAAIALAWVGCVLHLSSRGAADSARARGRAAHAAFVIAAAMTVAIACMGVRVAILKTF